MGEEVEIVGLKDTVKSVVTGVEMFRKLLDQGQAGDNVGVLLRGIKREDVERGQVLAKPGSINPHTGFKAEAYILTKEEGGRHTPFFTNYRPQFYFRTTDVTGIVKLPEGVEMVMPGDNVTMDVELIAPIAMDQGLRFAIREGGRTVGAGVVAAISADKQASAPPGREEVNVRRPVVASCDGPPSGGPFLFRVPAIGSCPRAARSRFGTCPRAARFCVSGPALGQPAFAFRDLPSGSRLRCGPALGQPVCVSGPALGQPVCVSGLPSGAPLAFRGGWPPIGLQAGRLRAARLRSGRPRPSWRPRRSGEFRGRAAAARNRPVPSRQPVSPDL